MNKFLKTIFLALTLLIPIVIFLFLKFFGENKFDIPVYYEEGVNNQFEGCNFAAGQPYLVQDATGQLPAVFMFLSPQGNVLAETGNIKQRFNEAVEGVGFVVYSLDSSLLDERINYLDSASFIKKMHCSFVTDTVNQFVLVDKKRRIRGYYDMGREETDRLIVETKILLENERNNK